MTRSSNPTTRRTLLKTTAGLAATASLAGCMGSIPGVSSGPEYDSNAGDVMLAVSDFPDGWRRNDETNKNFDAVFLGPDGGKFVMVSSFVKDDVQAAKAKLKSMRNTNSATNNVDIADTAYWAKRDNHARCAFRDSNFIGATVAAYQSAAEWVPDQNRAIEYARALHTEVSSK